MCIGYSEKVNKIIVKKSDGGKFMVHLGVYGLNICGKRYTYYDKQMQLHILNTDYIDEIELYNDNNYVETIEISKLI